MWNLDDGREKGMVLLVDLTFLSSSRSKPSLVPPALPMIDRDVDFVHAAAATADFFLS